MLHAPWRPWLLAGALIAVAFPAGGAFAAEEPIDAAPGATCVTRALRIGAAEVNGVVRRCVDPVTQVENPPPKLVLQTPPADGTPIDYTPLSDDQGSNATISAPDPSPETAD